MRSSTGYPRRTGWRAVFDLDYWLWALVVTTIGVVSMAMLACAVSLARDTTGHDWYATGKLMLTEVLIGIGADESAPVEYRTSRGEVLSLTRHGLAFNGNALVARYNVLRTAGKSAELGACCGFGGALLCLALFRRQDRRWRRHPAREQASVQPMPVASARERPEKLPGSRVQQSTRPAPGGPTLPEIAAGKTGSRATARRRRRKRDYGRWA